MPSRTFLTIACFLFLLTAGSLLAEPIELAEDFTPPDSKLLNLSPDALTEVDDQLFFFGSHPLAGRELWVSDGTPEGTRLVADTCPGDCGISYLANMAVLDGFVFFESCDPTSICQLWRSDGTSEGTMPITSLSRRGERVSHLVAWNGYLYFEASDVEHGAELFRSQGLPGDIELALDLRPGQESSGIRSLSVVSDRLFIELSSEESVFLFSDATLEGTETAATLQAWQSISSPFIDAGTRSFFIEGYTRLWTTDGTAEGTSEIRGFPFVISIVGTLPGRIVFTGQAFNSEIEDFEDQLWISDGTEEGTILLRSRLADSPQPGLSMGDDLYFGINNELWKTNGVETSKVIEIPSVPDDSLSLAALDDAIFIGSQEGLWRLVGKRLTRLSAGQSIQLSIPFKGGLSATTRPRDQGNQLALVSNAGLLQLSDTRDPGSTVFENLAALGDQLFLKIRNGRGHGILFDPETSEPRQILDLPLYQPTVGAAVEDRGFIITDDLWTLDIDNNPVLLFERERQNFSSLRIILTDTITAYDGRLLFLVWRTAFDGLEQAELWATNGTHWGTQRLDQLTEFSYCHVCSPPPPPPTRGIAVTEDRIFVYFESQLWTTNGLPRAASQLQVEGDCGPCLVTSITAVDDQVFFTQSRSGSSFLQGTFQDLWVSDGTQNGTSLIKSFGLPEATGFPPAIGGFQDLNGDLVFTVDTPALGEELWRSDGTEAGTRLVTEIRPGEASSNPSYLTVVDDQLFFTADDGIHGRELWLSDGSADGTRMVLDLWPGPSSSSPIELVSAEGCLVFAADDGVHGLEPWYSNGSAVGTRLRQDLQPGPLPSTPENFTQLGDQLYFSAGTEATGVELWTDRTLCGSANLQRLGSKLSR